MATRTITMPPARNGISYTLGRNDTRLLMQFDPAQVFADQKNNDLMFTHENGARILLKNFFAESDTPKPTLVFGKTEVAGEDLLASLGQEAMPAAGPVSAPLDSHGHYDMQLSELMGGIDALGTLDLNLNSSMAADNKLFPTGTRLPLVDTQPGVQSFDATLVEDALLNTVQGSVLLGARPGDGGNTFAWQNADTAAQFGKIERNADGTYVYTLNNALNAVQKLSQGDVLHEFFTYTYTDADGDKATGVLTISIYGTNDVPVAHAGFGAINEDGPVAQAHLPLPVDIDQHDSHSYIPQNGTAGTYGFLTVLADGSYTYTLNNALHAVQALSVGDSLTETFTYTVQDNHGGSASNVLTITINGTNDNPAVVASAGSINEDTPTLSAVLPAPTDIDAHDTHSYVAQTDTAGTYGSLTVLADGSYTYTLNNALHAVQALSVGDSLTETFTYTVQDNHGGTGSNILTITINGTNDNPAVVASAGNINEDTSTLSAVLPVPTDIDVHDTHSYVAQTDTAGTYGSLTVLADGSYTYTLNNALAAVQSLSVGDSLTETFTYTVQDNQGGTGSNVLTITINGTNDNPAVVASAGNINEDTSTLSAVLPVPTDIDVHDAHSYVAQTDTAGTYGSLIVLADGSYTYALNNTLHAVQSLSVGDSLTETFTYTVQDNHGGSASNVLTITINGTNDNPAVVASAGSINEDTSTLSAVLPVPTDIDAHDTHSYVAQTDTAGTYGSLTVLADGSYTYTLNNALHAVQALSVGDSLTETFTYTVQDNQGGTGSNVLTITINGTNDNPAVVASAGNINEDTPTLSAVLPIPTDIDAHDTHSYVAQTGTTGSYGSLTVQADGSYTYTLNNTLNAVQSLSVGDSLTETFNYTVQDNHGGSASNVLTITIHGTNDNPAVIASAGSINEDTPALSAVLPTPTDIDAHDTHSYVAQTGTAGTYGALTVLANGTYTYTLNNSLAAVQSLSVGDSLTETFNYTVQDNHGGSASNVLTITIHGTNDNPTVAASAGSINEDTVSLSANLSVPADIDAHDSLSFVAQSTTAGSYGSLSVAANGSYVYTLNNALAAVQSLSVGDSLTETFNYTVQDNHGGSASNVLTITIKGTNDTPTVAASTGSINEDTASLSASLSTPADIDAHDVLSFVAQTGTAGTYGTLHVATNGTYTYSLNNSLAAVQALSVGDSLTETFNYTVQDNHGGTANNVLTIAIRGTNDNPTVAAQSGSINEDTPSLSATLPTPADIDAHDTVSYVPQASTSGNYGSLNVLANGSYTYTLNNALAAVQALSVGYSLTETFTYAVQDNHGGTGTNVLTITINGTNDKPTVAASAGSIFEDTATLSAALPTPVDVDSHDVLSYVAQTGTAGSYGSLNVLANGTYTYTLNNALAAVQTLSVGDTLTETFNYTVQDNHGGTATNVLTITIKGTNDAPTVGASAGSINEDTPTLSASLPTPADIDQHDVLSYVPQNNTVGAYGSLTVLANGSYTYTLNNALAAVQSLSVGYNLTETFTYTVQDNHGGSVTNVLTITINGTNDTPTVAARAGSIFEDTATLNATLPTPADVDSHDTVSYVPQTSTAGTYGTLSVQADGSYTYTLNNALAAVQKLSVGDTLTESFNYTVQDTHGATASNVLTITIKGTNDNPAVAAQSGSINEDTATLSAALPTPTDIDLHDTLSYVAQSGTAGSYGSLSVLANGTYTYTLNNTLAAVQKLSVGDTLTETFNYTVQDNHGGIAGNVLTITINGTNDKPTVAAATNSVTEDTVLSANAFLPVPVDIDAHDTVSFTPLTNVAGTYGTFTINSNGAYSYTLNNSMGAVQGLGAGQKLYDTITYTVVDDKGGTGTNTLTITINGTNDAPTVGATVRTMAEDTATLTGSYATPSDPDNTADGIVSDTLTFLSKNNVAGLYGTITSGPAGSYTYTLNNALPVVQALSVGDTLTEVFTYTVSDGKGGTANNTITITITGTNDAPTVAAATNSVTEDTVLAASGTLPTPVDIDAHDTTSFVPRANVAGSYGTFNINADGTYTYNLNNNLGAVQGLGAGQKLFDTITYTVQDNHGGTGTNTLTITINGTNDAPSVGASVKSIAEDTPQVTGTLATPTDPDNTLDNIVSDTLTFTTKTNEAGNYGTLTLAANGTYTYVLNNSLSAVQSLSVGDSLTETFTYMVNDGKGGTAANTLTITINGTNDAPTVGAATDSVNEDTQLIASGTLPAPADIDAHDVLAFVPLVNTAGNFGTLNVNSSGGYSYSLNNTLAVVQALGVGEQLTETFTYTVQDNHGGSVTNTLTITINGTNDIPTVGAATASVTEDTVLVASGSLPTPADVDMHDILSFVAQTGSAGAYGTLTLNSNGTYTYNLNNALPAVQALAVGENLTDVFTYTVQDNHGGSSTNTLTVTINGTNDAPTVGSTSATVKEDTTLVASGMLATPHDTDVSDVLTFVAQSNQSGNYGTLQLLANGSYTYTLNNNLGAVQGLGEGESLNDVFTYRVLDGHGGSATNTLTIQVQGTNDAPTVAAAANSVTEDIKLTATGTLPSIVDPDNTADGQVSDTVSFVAQAATAGNYGSLTLNSNGTYTYTLNNSLGAVQGLTKGESLTDTFTYTAQDNHGGTGSNVLTITINGTNDAPTVGSTVATAKEDTTTVVNGTITTPADVDNTADGIISDTLQFITKTNEPGLYGKLSLNANGDYTYTLNNSSATVQGLGVGDTLTETYFYTVKDAHGGIVTNTLTITIQGTNDAPIATGASNYVYEDISTTASGSIYVYDPDNTLDGTGSDTITFTPKTSEAGQYGSLTLLANGTYTYTLNNSLGAVQGLTAGEHLTEQFQYTITDNHGATATNTLTITVNGTNDPPVLTPATATVVEDTVLVATGTVPTPTDPDNTKDGIVSDVLSFIPISNAQGNYGTLSMDSAGHYTYTLNNTSKYVQALETGQSVDDVFTYVVKDQHGGIVTSTLTVNVQGVSNEGSGPAAVTPDVTVKEDTTLTGTSTISTTPYGGAGTSFGPSGDIVGTYGTLHLQADGSYTYTLNNALAAVQGLGSGEYLRESFNFIAQHGGTSTPGSILVQIDGTNDAPIAAVHTDYLTEDSNTYVINTLFPVNDPDNILDGKVSDIVTATPSTVVGLYGTFTMTNNGSYTYVMNNGATVVQQLGVGESLSESFPYTVQDGHGGVSSSNLTFTINGTNDAPYVAESYRSITEGASTSLSSTLPTPTDVDIHDVLSFTAQNTQGQYGTLALNSNGSYTYTLTNPAVTSLGAGESAGDYFSYTVHDNHGGSYTNTLFITINGRNDAPVAFNASTSVTEDTTLSTSGMLPTPTDPDAHDSPYFVAQNNTAGQYGNLYLTAAGSYTYILNTALPAVQALGQGETLTDILTYTVKDGHGGTATASLTVTVNGTNDVPTVGATTTSVVEDTQSSATGSLATPVDVDVHDVLTFTAKTNEAGTYGTLTLAADGTYTYSLNSASALVQGLGAGEKATDTFTYTVSDGHGGTASNTLTVNITGENDAPVSGVITTGSGPMEDGLALLTGKLNVPADPDIHDTVTFVAQSSVQGIYGTLSVLANGQYTYIMNNNLASVQALGQGETGVDSFTIMAVDGHGGSTPTTLNINIGGHNDIPTEGSTTASVAEDAAPLTGMLTAPVDVDVHDSLLFTTQNATAGQFGHFSLNADGSYTYAVNNSLAAVQSLSVGDSLTETFNYSMNDGHGGTASNTITITINGTNDAPTVAASTNSINEDVASVSGTLPTPADVDVHDTTAFVAQSGAAGQFGSLTMNAAGQYTYTLDNSLAAVQGLSVGDSLTDTFTYTVQDNHGGSVSTTLTITINGTNDAPTVDASAGSIAEDTASFSGTLSTPHDVDVHDTLTFDVQTAHAGQFGNLDVHSDGSYTYTVDNSLAAVQGLSVGDSLTDTFTYTVQDNHGGSVSTTLTMTINGTNAAPTVDASAGSIAEDTASFSGTLSTPHDVDVHDTLTFDVQTAHAGQFGNLDVHSDGSYTYTMDNSLAAVQGLSVGDSLTDTFSYTVQDNHGGSVSTTLTITINGTNDAPTVDASAGTLQTDMLNLTGTLSTPHDVDQHDTLTFDAQTAHAGQYGSIDVHTDGSYTYTLDAANSTVQTLGTGQSLTESYTYTVSDGHGGMASNTLDITINGVDAPTGMAAPMLMFNVESTDGTSLLNGGGNENTDFTVFSTAPAQSPTSSSTTLQDVLSTDSSASLDTLLESTAPSTSSDNTATNATTPVTPTSTSHATDTTISAGAIDTGTNENLQDSLQQELVKQTSG